MPKRNLAWILVVVVIALLMWQLPQTIAGRDSVYRAFGPLVEVRAQIHKRYVAEIDDKRLVGAAVHAGINAMVEKLYDPYAIYLDGPAYERFRERTQGFFGGIGVDVRSTEAGLEVLSRAPGSPAAAAKIMPGDIITHIDGRATGGVPLVEAVGTLLNGLPGTEVTLTVVSGGGTAEASARVVTLRRVEISLDPVRGWSRSASGGWRFMLDDQTQIGYIRLTKFTRDVGDQMDGVMNHLLRRHLRGLVLDLRENTGGLLNSAIEVTDRFLKGDLIVRTSGRTADEKRWYATRDGTYPDFVMAVLVNGSTASAAEIVAGALRDHNRAVVVGERSYGKGSVQEVVELGDDIGAVKLTTAYYYLPGGQCIHRTREAVKTGNWGVAPTIPVNLTDRQREMWLAAWRALGRQAVATSRTVPASRAVPGPGPEPAPDGNEADARTAALHDLLNADLQLSKAVEYLQGRIIPNETSSASES